MLSIMTPVSADKVATTQAKKLSKRVASIRSTRTTGNCMRCQEQAGSILDELGKFRDSGRPTNPEKVKFGIGCRNNFPDRLGQNFKGFRPIGAQIQQTNGTRIRIYAREYNVYGPKIKLLQGLLSPRFIALSKIYFSIKEVWVFLMSRKEVVRHSDINIIPSLPSVDCGSDGDDFGSIALALVIPFCATSVSFSESKEGDAHDLS